MPDHTKTLAAMSALLREANPEPGIKALFRRTRFWMYAAIYPSAARIWMSAFRQSPLLADIARFDRRFVERPFHCFGYASMSALQRATMMRTHYAVMPRLLGESATRSLYLGGEACTLASCPQFSIVLRQATRCKREGLLTVASVDESSGIDLAWATITFESGTQGRPVRVFVGGLQGPSGCDRERVRMMTRACHGLRPKAAVMEAVMALCRLVGADRLTAVSRALHVSSAAASEFRADYDAFWREMGGIELSGRFVLPLAMPHRNVSEVPSSKRSAFRRRHTLTAQLLEQLEQNVQAMRGADEPIDRRYAAPSSVRHLPEAQRDADSLPA
ncbi:DUF535 family protein [Paraburkholderia silvatlantica]|uniref:DUF535 family protein n=1 Tax=Paraburkholderia silvatlantica TaxID=321895 RepID=UPI0037531E94